MSHRFLKAGKFCDIAVFGENLDLMSSGHPHPLYRVQVRVTNVKRLTTLARLEVKAVWLNFELSRILVYRSGALVLENLTTNTAYTLKTHECSSVHMSYISIVHGAAFVFVGTIIQ